VSCGSKERALEKAGWVCEHVCAEVPHRQFVLTIPKRLRLYFRYDRSLLGGLCQAAWRTVCTVYQATSGRPDGVPGMVGAIQTFFTDGIRTRSGGKRASLGRRRPRVMRPRLGETLRAA
jgi:hypothetical protein